MAEEDKKDTITVDVTGFFYRQEVPFTPGMNVLDVMKEAEMINNPTQSLNFTAPADDNGNAFVSEITVKFTQQPVSRQKSAAVIPPADLLRPSGTYSYDDNPADANGDFDEAKVIKVPSVGGEVPQEIFLAWQYYVLGDKKLLSGGDQGERFIKPMNRSGESPGPIVLEPGFEIRWRLVGIAGITDILRKRVAAAKAKREALVADTGDLPRMSFKSVMRMGA
ncbi:MAG: hypothetical protein AAGI12_06065 [Pseudomonadota bacterium]